MENQIIYISDSDEEDEVDNDCGEDVEDARDARDARASTFSQDNQETHEEVVVDRIDIENVPHGDPPESPRGNYRQVFTAWTESHPEVYLAEDKEEDKPVMDPPEGLLNGLLRQHQRQGLAWLVKRERSEPRGGILADDQVKAP